MVSGSGCRRLSAATSCRSWWPRSLSAWGSTSRTCASSSITICRRTSRATTRRPVGPGRDGLPAEALLLFGYGDLTLIRRLIEGGASPEQNRIELHKLSAMVGFAEPLTCRRRVLLSYFGEQRQEDCGNCDICLDPPERYDATENARKALSCVYRVGQRFGIGHVVEVLRGADSRRLQDLGHHRLSTFGIGRDLGAEEWGSLLRQLIHLGYLEQDLARYSVLRLTAAARPLLRGERRLELVRPRLKPRPARAARSVGGRTSPDYPQELFQALRALRKRIAEREGVPPFIVFGDATLAEMAACRPADEAALLRLNGVGRHKLARYGAEFLREISTFKTE